MFVRLPVRCRCCFLGGCERFRPCIRAGFLYKVLSPAVVGSLFKTHIQKIPAELNIVAMESAAVAVRPAGIPAAVWLFASGQTLPGIGLTLWCAVVVGSVDNVLRPRLVGNDAKMSDLMILLSTLGGITLFGAVGFVLGPIVAAVFVTIWEVYGRAFAHVLPAANEQSSAE